MPDEILLAWCSVTCTKLIKLNKEGKCGAKLLTISFLHLVVCICREQWRTLRGSDAFREGMEIPGTKKIGVLKKKHNNCFKKNHHTFNTFSLIYSGQSDFCIYQDLVSWLMHGFGLHESWRRLNFWWLQKKQQW